MSSAMLTILTNKNFPETQTVCALKNTFIFAG